MHLVISKRFEISLSYRYYRKDWSEDKNRAVFGKKVAGPHGFGGNFVAYFIFHGPVDTDTGMLINVTVIKKRILALLAERYDHKFLNRDTSPFDEMVPTPENVARQLLEDAAPLFASDEAELVACHVATTPTTAATAYADGTVERDHWLEFSAARRTWSPNLTDQENEAVFGVAASPSGHGHFYRLRATLTGSVDAGTGMIVPDGAVDKALGGLYALLDHTNLNTDVEELKNVTMTTEYLSRFMYERLQSKLPLARVRLYENPYFFAEYLGGGRHLMGLVTAFESAHRLHSPCLSDGDNKEIYGKCNNPEGHGHRYRVEGTIAGELDERTGAVYPLGQLQQAFDDALEPWHYKHLDLDTDDFKNIPSTGENIVSVLWPRLDEGLDGRLHRLRLWETPNNRFTLRRRIER